MVWQDGDPYWRDDFGGRSVAPKAANFLQYIWQNDCARPWFVYVETFAPAFIKLAVTLSLWQWDDVVRSVAGSVAGGAASTKGGKTHVRKKTIAVTDPENRERAYRRGLRTLLVITKPIEIVGFTYLIYGAGDQFFADWQSLLEESVYCTRQAIMGPYGRSGADFALLANPDGQGFGLDTLEYNAPNFGDTTAAVTLPAGVFNVAIGMKVSRQGGTAANVAPGFRLFGGGDSKILIGETATVTPDEPADLVYGGSVTVPFGETRSMSWELFGDDIPTGYYMHHCDVKVSPVRYY